MASSSIQGLVLDLFAPLSHKRTLRGGPEDNDGCPSWIRPDDWRRLNAYQLRAAYTENVARFYLSPDGARNDYREYGDAALLVSQAMAALLGREQTIAVDGAENFEANRGDGEASPADQGGTAGDAPGRAAFDRQQWLRGWADAERLPAKMIESERQSVGLGDSVYVLGWSATRQRARLRVYDPGLYFPVLTDDDIADFPTRVHLLWQVEDEVTGDQWLRRRTWQLGAIEGATEAAPFGEGGVLRRVLRAFGPAGEPVLQDGDRLEPDGRISRRYPWAPAGKRSTTTCYYTDGRWNISRMRDRWTVDTLPLSDAEFAVTEDGEVADRLDLHLDFLPVVHVPNSVAEQAHYGAAVIDKVAQLLDDLSSMDTDVAGSSALAGRPPVGLSGQIAVGKAGETITYGPGEVWHLGPDGRLDALDTSGQLAALRDTADWLRDRLSVNSRMPDAALGRVKPSQVSSGLELALHFGPMQFLIGEMRLVRGEKYALLLKMVQRLAQAAGALPAGETLRAEMRFGPFLPSDESALTDLVVRLLGARAVSLETALALLQAAGVLDVDDVAEEARRIREADYEAAMQLFEATGDTAAVRELLGLKPQAPAQLPAPPQIDLPGGGGQPPGTAGADGGGGPR